jgi:hypothetical protein
MMVSDGELDGGDFLSQLFRHTKAELLVVTAKGLAMTLRTNFPCHKQPANSVYYGYYMCKHTRVQERYTTDPECVRDYFLLGIDVYLYYFCIYLTFA